MAKRKKTEFVKRLVKLLKELQQLAVIDEMPLPIVTCNTCKEEAPIDAMVRFECVDCLAERTMGQEHDDE